MNIVRFVVSERTGTEMGDVKVFTNNEDAELFIWSQLANDVRDDFGEEMNEAGVDINDDNAVYRFADDAEYISGYAYIYSSDWHEFEITPVEIELTGDEETQIFYAVWRENHEEDARRQARDLELDNKLDDTDYKVLAERYEDKADCNEPENVTWANIITQYISNKTVA